MTDTNTTPAVGAHDALKAAFDAYLAENDKYSAKGVKAAGTRARKALADLAKACKARRVEIQNEKNAAAGK